MCASCEMCGHLHVRKLHLVCVWSSMISCHADVAPRNPFRSMQESDSVPASKGNAMTDGKQHGQISEPDKSQNLTIVHFRAGVRNMSGTCPEAMMPLASNPSHAQVQRGTPVRPGISMADKMAAIDVYKASRWTTAEPLPRVIIVRCGRCFLRVRTSPTAQPGLRLVLVH